MLEEAIAIAQQHNFTFPSSSESNVWFTSQDPITSQDFIKLANTVAARLLILSAHRPERGWAILYEVHGGGEGASAGRDGS